jgi:putative membrane protein
MTSHPKNPTSSFVRPLAAAAVCALALAALPAGAQGTSGSSTGGTGTASGAAGVTSSGAPRAAGASASGTGSMVSRDDSKMMADLAHANIAEIETGKMALEKSQNAQVKKFAQHMIDDHTSALKELQTLAQAKGVTLPDGTDMKHKTMATALKVMTGNSFDSQYMKRAGVGDHEQTIELLQKAQKNAKDPELKAMAVKMLPVVQGHLKMAQQGVTAVADKK